MEAFENLLEKLSLSTVLHKGIHLYAFGSATKSGATPNDVDVLLVYRDGLFDEAHALAERIRSTLTAPPYDVLVASETEAGQLDLVAKQGAVPIWPAGKTPNSSRATSEASARLASERAPNAGRRSH